MFKVSIPKDWPPSFLLVRLGRLIISFNLPIRSLEAKVEVLSMD